MNTVLRICLGLLVTVSAVGCRSCHNQCGGCDSGHSGCGHKSCLHKIFKKGDCGGNDACGCDGDISTCECHHHGGKSKKSKHRYEFPAEAAMYGYGNSVVYTGDDWQGMPQGMSAGCSGCGAPAMDGMMSPSTGCAGCSGGLAPTPNIGGGCASCGGNHSAPTPSSTGCASCGGNHSPTPTMPSIPPASGGCASCGASAANESFYNPLGPNHNSPAPAPPAEGSNQPSSAPPEGIPGGEKAAGSESIQKIHWVPRQL